MGFIDILMGRRPQLASTPPFVPGGRAGIGMIPSRPGVIDFLRDGITAAAMPNIAGGGALDTMRAIASGMGSAQQRENQQMQQQIAIAELSRKMENDAILAAARQAEAESDLARANLANRNASKVEPSFSEKFEMAKQFPGITPEKAAMWALTGKIPDSGPPQQFVEIDPEVAAYSGLSVPKVMKPVPTQVPTTDPANDPRVTDVIRETYSGPVKVSPSVGVTALQNWGRKFGQKNAPAAQSKPLPGGSKMVETSQGLVYVQVNPDGTVTQTETGVKPINKRRSGGGGGGSGRGKTLTPASASAIEGAKQREFQGILKKLDADETLDNPDFYIEQALDAQRQYEEKILAAGGDIPEEKSQQDADAIREAFAYRIAAKKARLEGKPAPQFRRRAPGGTPAPAAAPASVSGAPTGVTHRFNPMTGKIEAVK